MAAILWDVDNSAGPRSLSSPRGAPFNRFFEWSPDIDIIGPRRTAMGDGSQHVFRHRRDYTSRLAIKHLSPTQMSDALDLKEWLIDGGEATLVTDDADGNEYEAVTIRPGTTPEIVNDDDRRQHFAFRAEFRSTSKILVNYDD